MSRNDDLVAMYNSGEIENKMPPDEPRAMLVNLVDSTTIKIQKSPADLKHYEHIEDIRGYVDTDGLFIYAPIPPAPCPHCGKPLTSVKRSAYDPDWFPYCPACERRADYLYPEKRLPMGEIQSAEELARFISNNYCGVLMPIELKALTTLITAYRRAVLEEAAERAEKWRINLTAEDDEASTLRAAILSDKP